MRLSFSPTQEDWTKGAEERRLWLWDAVRRPFRLFRKYGSNECGNGYSQKKGT